MWGEIMSEPIRALVVDNLFFKLPADFNGTVDDAFELFVDYIKEHKKTIKLLVKDQSVVESFQKKCIDGEFKTSYAAAIEELIDDKVNGATWVIKSI